MKRIHIPLVLAAIALSSSAMAKQYGWCEVSKRISSDGYEYHLSAIVEVPESPSALGDFKNDFGRAFQQYVKATYTSEAWDLDCFARNTLSAARDYVELEIRANPGFRFHRTEWRGGQPAPTEAPPERNAGGRAVLTVKKDTGAAGAAGAWDEQAREQLRKEARDRAATIAKAAQADAEMKAKIQKFFDDMKKRGSAQ